MITDTVPEEYSIEGRNYLTLWTKSFDTCLLSETFCGIAGTLILTHANAGKDGESRGSSDREA